MHCEERDAIFGKPLRVLTGARISRFESFSFVRTFICDLSDWDLIRLLIATKLHMDGPNDWRASYRHTAVFSFLCTWNNKIYRMTLICYTRASCGNWCRRNFMARSLRLKLLDHSTEKNGRKNYSDFVLSDRFQYQVVTKDLKKISYSYFVPNQEFISPAFLSRNKNSMWRSDNGYSTSTLKWKVLKGNWYRLYGDLHVVAFPEFANRFGFVSSFAHQINRYVLKHRPTRLQKLELIYVALLSTSQITFFFVIEIMIESSVRRRKKESLFLRYIDLCVEHNLVPNGGAFTRYQPQPYKLSMELLYKDRVLLGLNLSKLDQAVMGLDDGNCLNGQGQLRKKPLGTAATELFSVGKVSATSFASLCVFTGLATSKNAIDTAKLSTCNNEAGYYKPMINYINQCYSAAYPEEEVGKLLPHNFELAWNAIGKSLGELVCTLENWSCATFRSNHKYDVFFQGETMYNLTDGSNKVKVKMYGSSEWIDKLYETDNKN